MDERRDVAPFVALLLLPRCRGIPLKPEGLARNSIDASADRSSRSTEDFDLKATPGRLVIMVFKFPGTGDNSSSDLEGFDTIPAEFENRRLSSLNRDDFDKFLATTAASVHPARKAHHVTSDYPARRVSTNRDPASRMRGRTSRIGVSRCANATKALLGSFRSAPASWPRSADSCSATTSV